MYTAETGQVITTHGFTLHQFTDNCPVYMTTLVSSTTETVGHFSQCLDDINAWMSFSRLRLNPSKTQVLWLCYRKLADKIEV